MSCTRLICYPHGRKSGATPRDILLAMADVQFDSDQTNEFGKPPQQKADFASKIISWGLVSSRKQAEYAMIGLAIVIIIIAFFVYRAAGG